MMPASDLFALVDRTYEAAFVPELWPSLLHDLSKVVDGVGASVFATDLHKTVRWKASPGVHQVLTDWVEGGWVARNQRTHRLVKLQHSGFVTTLDAFRPDEIENDSEHQDFLKPRGLGFSTGTFIPMPSGDVIVYSIERPIGLPDVSRQEVTLLDSIRPHLARAGIMAARLGLERAQAAADAFAALGLPAAALSASGALVATNSLFASLVPTVFQDRRGRLTITKVNADSLFQAELARGQAGCPVAVASIAVSGAEMTPHVIHLLPIKGAAQDIFARAYWLCVAMPVKPGAVPGAEVLQALFDLTPAEARVARAVGQAKQLSDMAAEWSVSIETVRAQLKSVFVKTGTERQAELTALLAGRGLEGS